jgi:SH3 domain-containing protein
MSRFVFVSFLFLGWGFYELSGGADFQPPERATQVATATRAEPARIPRQPVAALVANKPILTPRAEPRPAPQIETASADAGDNDGAVQPQPRLANGLSSGISLFPSATGTETLQLASLEDGAASLIQATVTDETPAPVVVNTAPEPDLREITGTRVNMRQGPGTNYPILLRLSIGQDVEVLDNSGTGWLRLRTVPDRTMGWIAASLVSKKRP